MQDLNQGGQARLTGDAKSSQQSDSSSSNHGPGPSHVTGKDWEAEMPTERTPQGAADAGPAKNKAGNSTTSQSGENQTERDLLTGVRVIPDQLSQAATARIPGSQAFGPAGSIQSPEQETERNCEDRMHDCKFWKWWPTQCPRTLS